MGEEILKWSEGKIFVIDDSFEHEVWQTGNGLRLVLLIDFWHPDLTNSVKERLAPLPVDRQESQNRSTVFHIGGIVNEITAAGNSVVTNEVKH